MSPKRARIFVAISVIAAILAISLIVHQKLFAESVLAKALNTIDSCMRRQSGSISCAQPVVRGVLNSVDGVRLMSALSERFLPKRCHQVGHIVGQQLFRKIRSVDRAISMCSRECDSACPHGIVSEASAQELGLDDEDFDFGHIPTNKLLEIGKRLCVSAQTCHGIGHAVFQAYQETGKALSTCNEVASGSMSSICYSGVFMEYADVLLSRSLRTEMGVKRPEVAELDTLCTSQPTKEAMRICFLYFPWISHSVYGTDEKASFESVARICERYHGDPRSACFAGMGSANAYVLDADVSLARAVCSRFPGIADQAACNFGNVYIASDDRQQKLFEYCGSLSSGGLRSVCFQGLFSRLYHRGNSVEKAVVEYCGSLDLCVQQSRRYELDPWEVIRETFGQ